MDWTLLIALLACLALGAGSLYFFFRAMDRTKKTIVAHQPVLRITNLSALQAGPVLTLTPEVENVGRGTAYDCVLQLSGWEGSFSVRSMYPPGPRHRKHAVPIVLNPEASLRAKSLSRGYLRLAYSDRWGLIHECWYPVTQIRNAATALYDIQIDLSHPELTEPDPSFWTMRKLMRRNVPDD